MTNSKKITQAFSTLLNIKKSLTNDDLKYQKTT